MWSYSISHSNRRQHCCLQALSAEIVQHDVIALNALIKQHLNDKGVHNRWVTQIILAVLRRWMVFQVIIQKDIMDKPDRPPSSYLQVTGQRAPKSRLNWD
jgi:hypothetical protein